MTLNALIVTGLAAASITVAAQEKMVMVGGESMLPIHVVTSVLMPR